MKWQRTITVIGCHVGGEDNHVIVGGVLPPPGATMFDAMTWLQAGDLAQARTHAQTCLEIVRAHDGPALERLFGWEALGTVEKAAGNLTGRDTALAQARAAFAELEDGDKAWCAESLDKLAAAA